MTLIVSLGELAGFVQDPHQGIAPVDFDFAGGKLGVIANDLAAGDNTTGESAGGVSPMWRITLLSACR